MPGTVVVEWWDYADNHERHEVGGAERATVGDLSAIDVDGRQLVSKQTIETAIQQFIDTRKRPTCVS